MLQLLSVKTTPSSLSLRFTCTHSQETLTTSAHLGQVVQVLVAGVRRVQLVVPVHTAFLRNQPSLPQLPDLLTHGWPLYAVAGLLPCQARVAANTNYNVRSVITGHWRLMSADDLCRFIHSSQKVQQLRACLCVLLCVCVEGGGDGGCEEAGQRWGLCWLCGGGGEMGAVRGQDRDGGCVDMCVWGGGGV